MFKFINKKKIDFIQHPLYLKIKNEGYTTTTTMTLGQAASRGQVQEIEELLLDKTIDPNQPYEGWTPLSYACLLMYIEIVSLLINDGRVDVNQPCRRGGTPLMCAAISGSYDVVAILMGDPRVLVNSRDINGNTAFGFAVEYGHIPVAKLLLADGRVNPNAENKDGHTALYYAARVGNIRMMETLLSEPRVKRIRPVVGGDNYDLALDKVIRRSRYWGLFRAIVLLGCLRLRAAQRTYAPGGAGSLAAAKSYKATLATITSSINKG